MAKNAENQKSNKSQEDDASHHNSHEKPNSETRRLRSQQSGAIGDGDIQQPGLMLADSQIGPRSHTRKKTVRNGRSGARDTIVHNEPIDNDTPFGNGFNRQPICRDIEELCLRQDEGINSRRHKCTVGNVLEKIGKVSNANTTACSTLIQRT